MNVAKIPWFYAIVNCVRNDNIFTKHHRLIRKKVEPNLCIRRFHRVANFDSSFDETHNRMVSIDVETNKPTKGCTLSASSNEQNEQNGKSASGDGECWSTAYERALRDLNSLQANTQVLALAKWKNPEMILPSFRRHMRMAGVCQDQLEKLNIIHVSGTKGKGSTCAFTESIIRKSGFKTGFYNSPHLTSVTERIQLNGAPIEQAKFSQYFRVIYDRLVEATARENFPMPSYFSFLTLLAFHVFIEEKVDCAIIEVGIGGEYDPTNVIEKPVACCISTLDLDHTSILGNTIESIAWTKAGIIKAGVPLFTTKHDDNDAQRAIMKRASERKSPVITCSPLSKPTVNLGIQGSAQYINASLACHLAHCVMKKLQKQDGLNAELNLENLPPIYKAGLIECKWPGRCQVLELRGRISLFIDGAHTRKSMENCIEWFKSSSVEKDANAEQILFVNVIGDRDKADVLQPLATHANFSHVLFTTNEFNVISHRLNNYAALQSSTDKSLDNAKINARVWRELGNRSNDKIIIKTNTLEAIEWLNEIKDPNRSCHVLVTGSLHFVGAVIQTVSLMQNAI